GYIYNEDTNDDFAVIKYDGATAAELWRREITGTETFFGFPPLDEAVAVAVDDADDVVAVGSLHNSESGVDFVVVKFDGATGDELWRQEIDGGGASGDFANVVVIDDAGDVIAVGAVDGEYAALKFDGSTGEEQW